jgi:Lar family restriction alleviation protein
MTLEEKAVIVARAMALRVPIYTNTKSGLASCLYFGQKGLEVSICGGGSWNLPLTEGFCLYPPAAAIKPCPFCGGQARSTISKDRFSVVCNECGAESDGFDCEERAISAWNQRTKSDLE